MIKGQKDWDYQFVSDCEIVKIGRASCRERV